MFLDTTTVASKDLSTFFSRLVANYIIIYVENVHIEYKDKANDLHLCLTFDALEYYTTSQDGQRSFVIRKEDDDLHEVGRLKHLILVSLKQGYNNNNNTKDQKNMVLVDPITATIKYY